MQLGRGSKNIDPAVTAFIKDINLTILLFFSANNNSELTVQIIKTLLINPSNGCVSVYAIVDLV